MKMVKDLVSFLFISPDEGSSTFGASPGNRENKLTASPTSSYVDKCSGAPVCVINDLVSRNLGLLVTNESDVEKIFLILQHLEG